MVQDWISNQVALQGQGRMHSHLWIFCQVTAQMPAAFTNQHWPAVKAMTSYILSITLFFLKIKVLMKPHQFTSLEKQQQQQNNLQANVFLKYSVFNAQFQNSHWWIQVFYKENSWQRSSGRLSYNGIPSSTEIFNGIFCAGLGKCYAYSSTTPKHPSDSVMQLHITWTVEEKIFNQQLTSFRLCYYHQRW